MPTAQILSAGITTIQDEGRAHYSHLGVPASGAWDRAAYRRLAHLLEQPGIPVLECLAGDIIIDLPEPALCAWTGPARVTTDGSSLPHNTVCLGLGRLHVQRTGTGPIYVGIAGLHLPAILGSASTDTHSGLGPAPLKPGVALPYAPFTANTHDRVGAFTHATHDRKQVLRFVPHDPDLAHWVTSASWTVTSVARSGVRYTRAAAPGSPPHIPGTLPSYPTLMGTIQVPSANEIIILGPDCGTTGGYATAGVIITPDIPATTHVEPGTEHGFLLVSPERAYKANQPLTERTYRSVATIA